MWEEIVRNVNKVYFCNFVYTSISDQREGMLVGREKCENSVPGVMLVRAYMQAAVETFAQVKQGHAMQVKIVPAPGTAGKGRNSRGSKEKYEPDAEDYLHGPVGRRYPEGQPHCRDIDEYDPPQVPATPADYAEPRSESCGITSRFFFHWHLPSSAISMNDFGNPSGFQSNSQWKLRAVYDLVKENGRFSKSILNC